MRKLFMANWKMTLTDDEAASLASEFAEAAVGAKCDVAVAPTFTALHAVKEVLHGSSVDLAAQDVFWEEKGAFTGEVSPAMLAELGVRLVIVGHSERRTLGETDEIVSKKTAAVRAAGMVPVICVGETAEERAAGRRDEVVRRQVEAALAAAPSADEPVVVAYEPRWAIGTGMPCDPGDAAAAHRLVRALISEHHGEDAQPHLRVLYGGSVDAASLASYVALREVDGVLVGGASAKIEQVKAMLASAAWS